MLGKKYALNRLVYSSCGHNKHAIRLPKVHASDRLIDRIATKASSVPSKFDQSIEILVITLTPKLL